MQSVEDALPEGITIESITNVLKVGVAVISLIGALSAFS